MEPQNQTTTPVAAQTVSPQPASTPTVRYSGLSRRLVAAVIDQLLILVVFFLIPVIILLVLGTKSENIPESANSLMQGFVGLMYVVYCTFFEARTGQTLGKKIVKIKVIQENGQACDFKHALIRNVLRLVDGIIGIFVLFIIAFTPKKQRIGDMLARTIVAEA